MKAVFMVYQQLKLSKSLKNQIEYMKAVEAINKSKLEAHESLQWVKFLRLDLIYCSRYES